MALSKLIKKAEQIDICDASRFEANELLNEPKTVRAIQRAKNEEACFRTEKRFSCNEPGCQWRRECVKLVAQWQISTSHPWEMEGFRLPKIDFAALCKQETHGRDSFRDTAVDESIEREPCPLP